MKCKFKMLLLQFFLSGILSAAAYATDATSPKLDSFSIEGRWDMNILVSGKQQPSWLEVQHSGVQTLVGRFVGSGGSARPISRVNFKDNKIHFSLPPQWEKETNDITFEGSVQGDSLAGTMVAANGEKFTWTAVRAPSLRRTNEPVWDKPISLFNGKNLTGWQAMGENQWIVENGILKSPKSGSNLVTEKSFTDFKLHIEFRYEKGSNSGVYLRGRYEVQIADSKGKDPVVGELGAVYGFITPSEQVAKEAGTWQTYDITLVGRMVSVIANGKQIICNQEIPGITGGAINSKEGEPGPIYLQGDHGPIEFRNITLTPAK